MNWYEPVVIMADLITEGLQPGCIALRRPAMPAICGQDIEVPDSELKGTRLLSKAMPVGLVASEYAARMLTPGAVISGYKKIVQFSLVILEKGKEV